MLRSLRGGDVDFVIGLLRNPVPEDLIQEPLAKAPYVIVARQGHPLFAKRKVMLDDLQAYDSVVGTPGACRRVCFRGPVCGSAQTASTSGDIFAPDDPAHACSQ